MPTRKQRRRRQKEHRHEYGYVLVDETGEERELDPEELRAQRQEREKPKEKQQPAGAKTGTDRRGRKIQPPSWRRAATRSAFFVVVLFVFISLTSKHGSRVTEIGLVAAYGVVSVPLFYWMDRMTYRRWQRAQEPKDDGAGSKRPAARRR